MQLKQSALFTTILLSGLITACDANNHNQTNMANSTMDVTDKTQKITLKGLSEGLKSDALTIKTAYKKKLEDVFIEDAGEVVKLLKDDTYGAQHQRFIVRVMNGKTVLIAHNIDIASRINTLQVGDKITFRGEYVYNPKGGILHWTHHDPDGSSAGGWIQHAGKIYQ